MSENDMKDWVFVPEEENEYIVDMSNCGYVAKLVGNTLELLPAQGATAPIIVAPSRTTAPIGVDHELYAKFCAARRAKIKRVVFGDGICGIGKYEFIDDRYKNLTSIHLGADMEFDATSFFGMYGLSEITCSEDNLQYQVIDNVLYSRDLKTLIRYTPGKPEAFFSVPDHVERLEHYAFMDANKLQCVKVGKNVKSIGNQCFDNCHNLRHIYIGEGVESIEGEYIFALSDYDGRIYLTREGLVIGGKAQSAAERWCAEINKLCGEYREELVCDFSDAITFSLIEDDEIDKFLTLPLPDLHDDKYLAKHFDTKDEIERNRPRLPNNDLPF